MRKLLLALLLMMAAGPAWAQETRQRVEGQSPPAARLADLAWLVGTWEGQGITGPAREVYSAPMGGQMIGHFIQARGEGIWFTEIMSIAEVGGSLEYRLKHFNEDLTGWEERERVIRFSLVAVERDAWFFDGLTIRRDGPDGMIGAVRVDNRDGSSREVVFRYRRAR